MAEVGPWKKWAALIIFAVQNAGAVLLMRYSKLLRAPPYSNLAAVMMQELVKLVVSTGLYMHECGGPIQMTRALQADIQTHSVEWFKLAVPSFLYTLQNVMLFVGAAHLEAAIAQVTYQSKIFFTAIFSVVLLRKELSTNQWIGIGILVVGVLCVQGIIDEIIPAANSAANAAAALASPPPATHTMLRGLGGNRTRGHSVHGSRQHRRLHTPPPGPPPPAEQVPLLGIGAMVLAAVCSSFASVFFEKMLKSPNKPSLWLRNIQLAAYSAIIALFTLLGTADPAIAARGYLHDFNGVTWAVVFTQSVGGIIVAVTIKYADNILRTFSQTVAVILGAFGSYFLFDFRFTASFNLGMLFVAIAIVLYGHQARTPEESYRSCVACCFAPAAL